MKDERQKAIDVALTVARNALRPSDHGILMAAVMRTYANNHPEEFVETLETARRKLEEQRETKSSSGTESYNSLLLKARSNAWMLLETLHNVGAGLSAPSELFEMMNVNPEFKRIQGNDLATICEQTYHSFDKRRNP